MFLFFGFLASSMASATQRFFSFALGKKDNELLKYTFCVNFVIYVLIAIIAVLLLETLGTWFVYNKFSVPSARFDAACVVFQFSLLSFLFSIITSPFMAIVIAHEDMQIYATVSIIEVVCKLGVVFLLQIIVVDKLVLYGILLFILQTGVALVYLLICLKKYEEYQFKKFYWDKVLFKETIDFTSWSLFGAFLR